MEGERQLKYRFGNKDQTGKKLRLILAAAVFIAVVVFTIAPAHFKTSARRLYANPAPAPPVAAFDHTHGQKSILFIRARFSDDQSGALPSDANLNTVGATAKSDSLAYSYNQFSLTWATGPRS